MQLGESIAVGLFVSSDSKHSESTCPWHSSQKSSAKSMDTQDGDEDKHGVMADNSGKSLGTRLARAGKEAPKGLEVSVCYKQGSVLKYPAGKKKKVLQTYENKVEEEDYELQYAPHHLIPGNESLKGSSVVAFLGDDDVIANFKKQGKPSSKIKKGMGVGYDVNAAENGEWLPSPYALSMSNEWPAAEGLSALRRRGDDKSEDQALESEAFKMAYAAAAIEVKPKKQFHMRHADYSNKVREILDALGAKIKLLGTTACPESKEQPEDRKFKPPLALPKRLNALSGKLRGLLNGPPTGWRNPLFTDELSQVYFEEYKRKAKKLPNLKVL